MDKCPLPLKNVKSNTDDNKKKLLSGKEALVKLLRWHFGYPEFRGKQLEAIQAVLSGTVLLKFSIHAPIPCFVALGGVGSERLP